ncbi:MFS transporter [Quadrisphaera sp. GCM10027208]|uniref:MFS transporter n=1 Tax=Quadrisphaera sp. GCM10027208 TaxID=3273423 RepID=UPI00361E3E1F
MQSRHPDPRVATLTVWWRDVPAKLCQIQHSSADAREPRAAALTVVAAAQRLANFTVSTTIPALADVGLTFAYGLYAVMAAVSFVFVARAVRETKGMELEDMPG